MCEVLRPAKRQGVARSGLAGPPSPAFWGAGLAPRLKSVFDLARSGRCWRIRACGGRRRSFRRIRCRCASEPPLRHGSAARSRFSPAFPFGCRCRARGNLVQPLLGRIGEVVRLEPVNGPIEQDRIEVRPIAARGVGEFSQLAETRQFRLRRRCPSGGLRRLAQRFLGLGGGLLFCLAAGGRFARAGNLGDLGLRCLKQLLLGQMVGLVIFGEGQAGAGGRFGGLLLDSLVLSDEAFFLEARLDRPNQLIPGRRSLRRDCRRAAAPRRKSSRRRLRAAARASASV